MAFSAKEHMSNLKGKDYLEVKWRIYWFREDHPHGIIKTSMEHFDVEKGLAVFKASVEDSKGGYAEGHGSETARDFGDYIEKAETKAIGRALAELGYGTQFAPELEEGERIVDSPVERRSAVQHLSKEAVELLRQDWAQVRNIAPDKVQELWRDLKTHLNGGTFISDERITPAFEQKIRNYISQKRPQQKAS